MKSKLDYVCKSLSKGTHKKYETFVINAIYNKLNNPELEIVTQQYVFTNDGKKFIDLYFPQLKIAVEVDEGYHENPWQTIKDKRRVDNIKLSILESTIVDKGNDISFIRIKLFENGKLIELSKLNEEIDNAVVEINNKIKLLKKPLVWEFDKNKKLQSIIDRGYLVRGDSFDDLIDIFNMFGAKYTNKNKQIPCTYREIWSPTLSVNGSNRGGWVNEITEDLTEIFEYCVDGKHSKNQKDVDADVKNKRVRYVFLKYKDALNDGRRRFIGVYRADRFDAEKNAEVWKYVADTIKITKL